MLKNINEVLVEQKLEMMWKNISCCKCEKCTEDIMAMALNNLSPRYVSTEAGELFVRAGMLSLENEFDVTKQVALALNTVIGKPRH